MLALFIPYLFGNRCGFRLIKPLSKELRVGGEFSDGKFPVEVDKKYEEEVGI